MGLDIHMWPMSGLLDAARCRKENIYILKVLMTGQYLSVLVLQVGKPACDGLAPKDLEMGIV